jgi:hypothetical protein
LGGGWRWRVVERVGRRPTSKDKNIGETGATTLASVLNGNQSITLIGHGGKFFFILCFSPIKRK